MELIKENKIVYYTRDGLKLQQLIMINLLKILSNICEENNIDYWIDGGTLLGYKRHGGFIPWDDDIDVCIPIKDYHKVLVLLREYSKSNNTVLYNDLKKEISWCDYFCSTEYIYEGQDGMHKPVKIDLLPVKSIPIDKLTVDESRVEEIAFYIRGYKKNNSPKFNHKMHALDVKRTALADYQKYMIMHDTLHKNNLLIKGHGQFSPIKNVEYNIVYPLKKVLFEGVSINAPANINAYLEKTYGHKYELLPCVEKRKPVNLKACHVDNEKDFLDKLEFHTQFDKFAFYYNGIGSWAGHLWYLYNCVKYRGIRFSFNRVINKIRS